MDDREIVSSIAACLASRIGKDRYEVWFGAAQFTLRGERLVVAAPSEFFQDWLRSHFRKELEAAALEAAGRPLVIEFRVAAAPATPAPATPSAKPIADPVAAGPARDGAAPAARCSSASSNGHRSDSPDARCVRRLASLEGFVVGSSNCVAHKAAQMTVEQPGTYSPLVIHGLTGTGKTHLLEGICSAFRQKHPRARTLCISSEQFTWQFIEALRGSGMPSFRRKYRDLDLLAIDDLQFFKEKRATITELQHTIDTLLRAGRQLVLASDRAPAALKSLGPELIARLSGGMICRVEPADYQTRRGIVRQLAAGLGLAIGPEIEAFIAAHFTSQSRELAGAVKRLKAMSLAHARTLTLAIAEESLADLIDHQGRVVKLADIERAVCDVFGLSPDSLQSSAKAREVSHPRMLAMWLAQVHAGPLERDRYVLWPADPQHRDFGAEESRIVDGRRRAASDPRRLDEPRRDDPPRRRAHARQLTTQTPKGQIGSPELERCPLHTNFVKPGMATVGTLIGPHSYLPGVRSSFDARHLSQVSVSPV